jgi:hypothetical protein
MERVSIREAASKLHDWFMEPAATPASNQALTTEPAGEGGAMRRNEPLSFAELKHLDPDHETLAGLRSETVAHFGLGYATRGIMRGHVAIPIHTFDGTGLLAYVGWNPETGGYKYPERFIQGVDLYNAHRAAEGLEGREDAIIIVLDFLDVFRLHEMGYPHAVALMGGAVSPEQLFWLERLVGEWGRVTLFFPREASVAEALFGLVAAFHARLVRSENPIATSSDKEIRAALL